MPLARPSSLAAIAAPVTSMIWWLCACTSDPAPQDLLELEQLGEALFSDTDLSFNRTQSCATCHDPDRGFVDGRQGTDGSIAAVSRGDDDISLGDRNAPTAAYAAYIFPATLEEGTRARHNKQNANRLYEGPLGGLFLDGRAGGLAGQAAGPPLNPLEMGMPDEAAVSERLQEKPEYVAAFREHFGANVFDDPLVAYQAMADAIAAYERTEAFAPFDSKYDRFLRGEAVLSFKENTGKSLFFSEFTNCAICHQLHENGDPLRKFEETFSGYEFHNIGVPVNEAVRSMNGVQDADPGLAGVPGFEAPEHLGKFKTPTLRNVAVTGPYMHNGVFRDLKTVVLFYEHFVSDDRDTNPETGNEWRAPEHPSTVNRDLLTVGDGMTELEVESLVCFLRTLTDRRYEDLVEDKGIACAD